MSDIVHWLRKLAALVEADHAPQHVVIHMRAGADEIERLRAENAALAAWQCEFTDGKTGLVAHEHGGTYCAMATKVEQLLSVLADTRTDNMRLREWNAEIALNGRELVAENERLRAALRPFAEAADGFDMPRIKNPEEWFAYRGIVSATEAKGAITVGDLRRARAALNGQPAPSGWRPIDQPPSHPMRVLLFSPEQYDANWSGADYGMRVAYYANGQWRDQGTNHDAFEFDAPTHWMPLPPAPEKEEA